MTRESSIHLADDICRSAESFSITRQVEAPSKALQEKREAWLKAKPNLDKPMHDFLLWVQKLANEPHNGLTNRQRREWIRKERRWLSRPITEDFFQRMVSFRRFLSERSSVLSKT
jgi:hypothetical protein